MRSETMTGNRLRAIIGSGFHAIPGIYDVLTACLIERLGFAALYLPGNALGLQLGAGQPLVTLTETVDATRRIAGALNVPLIVDAGAGFGAEIHVHRTVRELSSAGAAAIHIDDQPYPKQAAYHAGNGRVAHADELAAKLRTAKAARGEGDMLLIARSDVWKVTGSIEETIRRAQIYVEAGADALMILNLPAEHSATVRDAVPQTPLIWFATPSDAPPPAGDLAAAGFSLGLYPFDAIAAAAQAVVATWRDFATSGVPLRPDVSIRSTVKLVQEAIGMDHYLDIEALRLSGRNDVADGDRGSDT